MDGGVHYFPNPPYDDAPQLSQDALTSYLPADLEPDALEAYRRGFLAALQLREPPQVVTGAGGTAAGDALRAVVLPLGGEIYEPADEIEDSGDEDATAAGDAGAYTADLKI